MSLRYSVVPAVNGESIVIRILDQSAQVGSLEDLGMMPDTAMRFRAELRRPNGILLVSGPTGHGKCTTLAAAVPWLDSRTKRILSVEDPVEYRLRTVTQAPVSARLTFASALRAFLRHNPDIIIVGDIRDSETAALAMRLALTGHLILSTVHANTAVHALSRLLDLGVEAHPMLAATRLLLGQRLVKRLCPNCRRPHRKSGSCPRIVRAPARARAHAAGSSRGLGGAACAFHEAGGGCGSCGRSGYSGRVGNFSSTGRLEGAIGDLLVRERNPLRPEGRPTISTSEAARNGEVGARSMREDGMLKAALGLTTPEEVLGATMQEA